MTLPDAIAIIEKKLKRTERLASQPQSSDLGRDLAAAVAHDAQAMRILLEIVKDHKVAGDDAQLCEAMAAAASAGIEIDTIGGNCPVQAEGTVDGHQFYFRARGERWQLHIGDEKLWFSGAEWWIDSPYCQDKFIAGWLPQHEAVRFIIAGVMGWRARINASDRQAGDADFGIAP